MPTIAGMRRRGYTPESIRNFCKRIGVSKKESRIDMLMLEEAVREDLNEKAPRVMGVLRPLKVIIDNYPEGQTEEMDVPNHPGNPDMGRRKVPFSKEIYIEREDFMEEAPKKFFRLAPGREVRLRSAFFIKCESVVKDEKTGEVVVLHCSYDPATRGGSSPDGRKVKGTLHWVSARHSLKAEVRLYDRLFVKENPDGTKGGPDYKTYLNEDSLEVLTDCRVEPSLASAAPESRFQFERQGYFCVDSVDSKDGNLVFNRTSTLRDSWVKAQQKA
ncbi:MAG: glutamine--tRNA ligase, partial [Proteobacteria bacterium]|nr:glutamine--tRNA ligase [Pseudomonadota bacterium]